jgi:hypothetical protein
MIPMSPELREELRVSVRVGKMNLRNIFGEDYNNYLRTISFNQAKKYFDDLVEKSNRGVYGG